MRAAASPITPASLPFKVHGAAYPGQRTYRLGLTRHRPSAEIQPPATVAVTWFANSTMVVKGREHARRRLDVSPMCRVGRARSGESEIMLAGVFASTRQRGPPATLVRGLD
jgi:hypothetical protein